MIKDILILVAVIVAGNFAYDMVKRKVSPA